MKTLDTSQSMISVLIGTVTLIGWSIREGGWTWINYVALGFGVWIGIGVGWLLFMSNPAKEMVTVDHYLIGCSVCV